MATPPPNDAMHGDAMRAYQEYMLHGSKAKLSEDKTSTSSISSPMDRSGPRATWKDAPWPSRTSQRQLRLLRRSFREAVRDWVDTDDQLLQVVQSIANLRDRVFITSRALAARVDQEGAGLRPPRDDGWTNCGYRRVAPSQPPEPVLQLALSDGLIQHEKMLALLRQLVSQLSQNQDAMGRRLEDLFVLQLQGDVWEQAEGHSQSWKRESRDRHSNDDSGSFAEAATDPVQNCVDVHAACSRELYRKQVVAQILLASTSNAMLHADDEWTDEGDIGDDHEHGEERLDPALAVDPDRARHPVPSQEHHPRRVAHWCARQWSRESKSSELHAVRDQLIAPETLPSEST